MLVLECLYSNVTGGESRSRCFNIQNDYQTRSVNAVAEADHVVVEVGVPHLAAGLVVDKVGVNLAHHRRVV